jgi:ParB family transcriptional regulator, chromosome partitioning protein
MNNTQQKNPKLGKGMAALFGQVLDVEQTAANNPIKKTETVTANNTPMLVDISKIVANKDQPRKIFKEKEIQELAESIKENGLIQPIIVRELETGKFEVIAGERRLRASKLAGLERVPVFMKRASNKDTLMMAIVENVQRQDLNCVEEALAYYQLMEEFKLTQEEVAKKIGKDRSTIANFLRILKLPREVLGHIQKDAISFGHAKVLASLKDDEFIKRLANVIIADQLSVRELEEIIKKGQTTNKKADRSNTFFDERIDAYMRKLESKTGYHFDIKSKKNGSGIITIKYNNEAEFNDVYEYLMK